MGRDAHRELLDRSLDVVTVLTDLGVVSDWAAAV
jgi:hypothetical protein